LRFATGTAEEVATNGSMRPRLLLSLAAIIAIGVLTVWIVATTLPSQNVTPPPSTAPSPSAGTRPPTPAAQTYPDFVIDPQVVKSPTSSSAQSKLWFAQDAWWGLLFSPGTDRVDIFRLDPKTQVWADTGTLVDERLPARSDALWDGTHLYVVSGGSKPSPAHAILLRRFAFDATAKRYVLDPGFPVTINPTGGSPAVITKDSSDVVWVAFTADGKVFLSHTLDHDAQWSKPSALTAAEAQVDPTDVAAITAFGPGKVGLVWTNLLKNAAYASVHDDAGAPDAWSAPETILGGTGIDNQLSVAALPLSDGGDTNLATTISTLQNQGDSVHQLDPLTMLAVRDASGTWGTTLVGLVRDHHTRPVLMVDPDARSVFIAATSPGSGGTVYYKRSSLDAISFDTGKGTPLLTSTVDQQLDDITSTKGPLTKASGLVALGVDRTTGRYSHAVVDLGGGAPTANPADPARPKAPTPIPPKTTIWLLRDDFDELPVGRDDGGWFVRPEDPQGRLAIVDDGLGGHALRVPSSATGVRACRGIPRLDGARVTVSVRVRVSVIGASDAVVLGGRGSGGEAGSIRFSSHSLLAWYGGSVKVRSTVPVRARGWYRIVATFDARTRTYSLRVTNAANKLIAARSGLRWRTKGVTAVDAVCIDTAGAPPAQVIDIAEVNVQVPVS
jgi:hypothetical protein